MNFSTFMLY